MPDILASDHKVRLYTDEFSAEVDMLNISYKN